MLHLVTRMFTGIMKFSTKNLLRIIISIENYYLNYSIENKMCERLKDGISFSETRSSHFSNRTLEIMLNSTINFTSLATA